MKNVLLLLHAHPVESGPFEAYAAQNIAFKKSHVSILEGIPSHFLTPGIDQVWHSFVGVGTLQASQTLSSILTEFACSELANSFQIKNCAFIGSFGWYPKNQPLAQVITVDEAVLWDRGRLDQSCYIPQVPLTKGATPVLAEGYFSDKTLSRFLFDNWVNFRRAGHFSENPPQKQAREPMREYHSYKIASCVGISVKSEQAHLMHSQWGFWGENMEVAAVASVCTFFELPWAALLVATNWVNEDGHKDWVQFHKKFLLDPFR